MRKLKTKEKKKEEFDIVKHREQAMLNAQRILEKEDDFKLFAAIIKNSDSMPMPVVTSTAAILASITSASFIKDKNKKAKAENTIRIQATKYLHEIAGELLPNANTHIFMLLLELNEIISDYTEAESIGCRKFIVVESGIDCSECSFDKMEDCLCTSLRIEHFIPECSGRIRKDAKDVIFMEVENEKTN